MSQCICMYVCACVYGPTLMFLSSQNPTGMLFPSELGIWRDLFGTLSPNQHTKFAFCDQIGILLGALNFNNLNIQSHNFLILWPLKIFISLKCVYGVHAHWNACSHTFMCKHTYACMSSCWGLTLIPLVILGRYSAMAIKEVSRNQTQSSHIVIIVSLLCGPCLHLPTLELQGEHHYTRHFSEFCELDLQCSCFHGPT